MQTGGIALDEVSLGQADDVSEGDAAGTLAGARLLVVGINYAPEHTGIAPYTTRACEYFVEQGAEVAVLAGIPHYPHWEVPRPYRYRVSVEEQRAGVPVRRLRHYVPRRQSAVHRGVYEASFAANVLGRRLPWKPDAVLAVVPSLLGAAAAARIARRTGARFVVWAQDLMGPAAAQSGMAGGTAVAGLTGRIERRVMRAADEVVVLNDSFGRAVLAMGVDPAAVTMQPNWTHIESPDVPPAATRARMGWRDDEVVVLHSGNMGLKQGLEHVVAAARLAGRTRRPVRFVLMGDGSQRERLEREARGVAQLDLLPAASHEDFPNVLAAADLLLVNERSSAVDMSLPSKLTSYFRAGRPVVAAVHPDGGTAHEVRRSGAGATVVPENPAALLDAVIRLSGDSERYTRMRAAATSYADQHLGAAGALASLAAALVPPGPEGAGGDRAAAHAARTLFAVSSARS